MEIKANCKITELPQPLQRLAVKRLREFNHERDPCEHNVGVFVWSDTPEREGFWVDVYKGKSPVNLQEVLNKEFPKPVMRKLR